MHERSIYFHDSKARGSQQERRSCRVGRSFGEWWSARKGIWNSKKAFELVETPPVDEQLHSCRARTHRPEGRHGGCILRVPQFFGGTITRLQGFSTFTEKLHLFGHSSRSGSEFWVKFDRRIRRDAAKVAKGRRVAENEGRCPPHFSDTLEDFESNYEEAVCVLRLSKCLPLHRP